MQGSFATAEGGRAYTQVGVSRPEDALNPPLLCDGIATVVQVETS